MLSNNTVTEVAFIGTVIGTFDIVNAYAGSPKYFLTNDAGGQFMIVGNQLRLAKTLDYETAASHADRDHGQRCATADGAVHFHHQCDRY